MNPICRRCGCDCGGYGREREILVGKLAMLVIFLAFVSFVWFDGWGLFRDC